MMVRYYKLVKIRKDKTFIIEIQILVVALAKVLDGSQLTNTECFIDYGEQLQNKSSPRSKQTHQAAKGSASNHQRCG